VQEASRAGGHARRGCCESAWMRRSSCAPDAPQAGKVALVSGGAPGTSRCTESSSGAECSTRPARAQSSPRRCPATCWPPRRRPTAGPGPCGCQIFGRRSSTGASRLKSPATMIDRMALRLIYLPFSHVMRCLGCWRGARRRKPSSSCYATKSPCCDARWPGRKSTGQIGRC
jgi:hypothetical protein